MSIGKEMLVLQLHNNTQKIVLDYNYCKVSILGLPLVFVFCPEIQDSGTKSVIYYYNYEVQFFRSKLEAE